MSFIEKHVAPWGCTFAKEDKSKCESGRKPKSDKEYFEVLCLCVLQAGLNWKMVRKNWKKFRKGFYNFDFDRLANSNPSEILKNEHVIKNLKKIKAIVENAKEFKKIKRKHGSFSNFLESLKKIKDEEVFKILKKRFRHVGEYTAEYYLHSIGYWKSK